MTSAVLNVSNKFGFLNISDSEDEGGWQKPKKSATAAKKGEGIYQNQPNKKNPPEILVADWLITSNVA